MSYLYNGLISQDIFSRIILLSVNLSIYPSISTHDIISLCQLFYSCLVYNCNHCTLLAKYKENLIYRKYLEYFLIIIQ